MTERSVLIDLCLGFVLTTSTLSLILAPTIDPRALALFLLTVLVCAVRWGWR